MTDVLNCRMLIKAEVSRLPAKFRACRKMLLLVWQLRPAAALGAATAEALHFEASDLQIMRRAIAHNQSNVPAAWFGTQRVWKPYV